MRNDLGGDAEHAALIQERFRREAQTLASMRSRHTIELYRSLRDGYRPAEYATFPSVVILVRSDGEMRAVRYQGHHRLCLLAHLGHEELTVGLRPESLKVVDEREVEDWYYVRKRVCSPEQALRIFRAFFDLTGSERLEYLRLPRAY